jgi:hypothetical protein
MDLIDNANSPWRQAALIEHARLLAQSFQRCAGRPLADLPTDAIKAAERLYHAPFVLLSHGTETDPLFNYANLSAQKLWDLGWREFVGMPSRKSAEVAERAERSAALSHALDGGIVEGYSGVRISASGRRFMIEDGLIWNVRDDQGVLQGQAATFSIWRYLCENA